MTERRVLRLVLILLSLSLSSQKQEQSQPDKLGATSITNAHKASCLPLLLHPPPHPPAGPQTLLKEHYRSLTLSSDTGLVCHTGVLGGCVSVRVRVWRYAGGLFTPSGSSRHNAGPHHFHTDINTQEESWVKVIEFFFLLPNILSGLLGLLYCLVFRVGTVSWPPGGERYVENTRL